MCLVRFDLLRQVPCIQPRACFLDHDHRPFTIQQVAGSAHPVGVGRRPFLESNLIELKTEEGVEEVLEVLLVLDFQGRAVFVPQAQLSGHQVKACAQPSQQLMGLSPIAREVWGRRR